MIKSYTNEISAELLLNLLYPDRKDKWIVKNKGTFYRNYSADVLSIDEVFNEVELSRDGYLKLLPQGLIALDDELKGSGFSDKYEDNARRQHVLREAFAPFDTFAFRRRLNIEEKLSELLNSKIDYLLQTFFHYDRSAEINPYIKTLAVTLPYIHQLRANFPLVKQFLQHIFDCEVEMQTSRYGDEDDTRHWLPWLRYNIYVDHLSSEQYRALQPQVQELEAFVQEWYMPFDIKCSLRIKHHPDTFPLDHQLTLDYNTMVSEE